MPHELPRRLRDRPAQRRVHREGGREIVDRQVVLDGDRDRLQRIPGIGRKTAERILLELRDRLEREDREARRPRGGAARAAAEGSEPIRLDAVSALQNLGYARQEANEAVDRALAEAGDEPPSLERVLKSALRNLVQGGRA